MLHPVWPSVHLSESCPPLTRKHETTQSSNLEILLEMCGIDCFILIRFWYNFSKKNSVFGAE